MRECIRSECVENYNGECIRTLWSEDHIKQFHSSKPFECILKHYKTEYDNDEEDIDWLEDKEIGVAFPLGPMGGNVTHELNPYENFIFHYPDITEEKFPQLKMLQYMSMTFEQKMEAIKNQLKEKGLASC